MRVNADFLADGVVLHRVNTWETGEECDIERFKDVQQAVAVKARVARQLK